MSRTTPDIQPTNKHDIQVLVEAPRQNKLEKLYSEMHGKLRSVQDIHKKISEFHSAPST